MSEQIDERQERAAGEGHQPDTDVRDGNQSAVIGETGHAQHRAGPGEGVRAPLVQDGADHAEFSIFDGKGNESVVVVTTDDEGRIAEGTGPTSAAAMKDARKSGDRLGNAFGGKH
ncbi:MAG: hypothetical protein M3083_00025 [Actinomycetota bacterium]|nr:hypothetical protein [Actinomycetota bacterium]MDQ6946609.1 hypothetical protein [Actinomycetota bacterium]